MPRSRRHRLFTLYASTIGPESIEGLYVLVSFPLLHHLCLSLLFSCPPLSSFLIFVRVLFFFLFCLYFQAGVLWKYRACKISSFGLCVISWYFISHQSRVYHFFPFLHTKKQCLGVYPSLVFCLK